MISSPLLTMIPDTLHVFGTRDDIFLPPGIVTVRQVHGVNILFAKEPGQSDEEGYDIVITDRPGIPVSVRTADCLPVLIVEPDRKLLAAVHAGWKGTLTRASQVAISKLRALGGDSQKMRAAMGPSMGARCYEVDEDVADPFRKEFPKWPRILKSSDSKWLLNVPETNRLQLLEMGLKPENIDHIDLCTHCRTDLFHSYRRDGEKAGRMVNWLKILE